MSIDLVAAALWIDLPPPRKLVLIALCDRANGTTGECYPGLREIRFRSSMSERSVIPHLRALEESGYVRRGRGPTGRKGETTHRWLDVQRILQEGRSREQECKSLRWSESIAAPVEESSTSCPDQLKLTSEPPEVAAQPVEAASREPVEAASRGTVIHGQFDPSLQNRARSREKEEEPHGQRTPPAQRPTGRSTRGSDASQRAEDRLADYAGRR